jgi:hypothetical protein
METFVRDVEEKQRRIRREPFLLVIPESRGLILDGNGQSIVPPKGKGINRLTTSSPGEASDSQGEIRILDVLNEDAIIRAACGWTINRSRHGRRPKKRFCPFSGSNPFLASSGDMNP